MSPALSLLSNNLQVYGPSESLPCLGVSRRAGSTSPCPQSERRTLDMSVMSPKCYFRDKSFVCKARFGGQRRDSDFSRQNKHESSQIWTRQHEERDDSDDLSEFEFVPAKNGRLPSLSNSQKDHATDAPGPREMEIVGILREVQALLRERKGEKRFEAGKNQNKEDDKIVEPLLQILNKHVEGKKANIGFSNEFRVDRKNPRQSRKFYEEKGKSFVEPIGIVREESQETKRPSFNRPESNFQRRSPVSRIRYEPVASSEESFNSVSHSDLDEKSGETHSESELGAEADFDFEPQETKRPSFSRPVSNSQRRPPVPRIRYEPIVSSEESFNSVSHLDLDEKSGKTHSESDYGAEADFDFEPQETKRPSSRPVSNFQWRFPVSRTRYEPIVSSEESFNSVSHSDLDKKSGETHSESDLGAEAEFDFEPDMDLTSEEEEKEELERAVLSETDFVNGHAAEFSAAEENNVNEREAEKQRTELKDLNAMKLDELREVARARGMKGYSKLKKSELLRLLSEDAI